MFRLSIFCLCVSLIWATLASKGVSKVVPKNLPGSRIFNGEPATLGQFPFQVALFIIGDRDVYFCGGTLLTEQWILTAGHCIYNACCGQAMAGSVDPYGDDGGEYHSIADLIVHEDYDPDLLANDIGLVRVFRPFNLSDYIQPIRLNPEAIPVGQEVIVSGWGLSTAVVDNYNVTDTLNYATLLTISNQECEESFGEGSILDEMVCAVSDTGEVEGICGDDSGGPLMIGQGEETTLVGVVSFVADSGCESGAPSGFTRIAGYVDWIEQHIGGE